VARESLALLVMLTCIVNEAMRGTALLVMPKWDRHGKEGTQSFLSCQNGLSMGVGLPGWLEIELRRSILWMVEVGAACKVCAKVLWERVPKCGKAGQRDTLELSQEPGIHGTEGLVSARRLRGHARTGLKRKRDTG